MEQPFSNCWQVIMSHECNAFDAMFLKFKRPEHLKTHLSLVLKNLFFYCRPVLKFGNPRTCQTNVKL